MFLKPVPKGPSQFSNVLLFTTCLGTFKPVDYPTLLGVMSLSLGATEKVTDGIVSLEVSLYSNFITHLLKTFTDSLHIGYH